MGEGAVLWIKLVIPLVVHSASKVRLRAAAALEMGMPLLLEKQQEVAAIVEPMMSSVSLFLIFHLAETLQECERGSFVPSDKAVCPWVGGNSGLL